MDKVTMDRIAKLHPNVRNEMTNIINECNKALTGRSQVRIAQGLRTFAEQEALYQKRPKVTNAKAGQILNTKNSCSIPNIVSSSLISGLLKKSTTEFRVFVL